MNIPFHRYDMVKTPDDRVGIVSDVNPRTNKIEVKFVASGFIESLVREMDRKMGGRKNQDELERELRRMHAYESYHFTQLRRARTEEYA